MKDVKKLLKEDAKRVLPDERIKENIKAELGYTAEEAPVLARADGGTETVKNKKKLLIPAIGAAAIVLILAILLPILLPGSPIPGPAPLPGNKFAKITDADSFYAYGAASLGTLLAAEGNASPVAAAESASAALSMKSASARSDAEEQHVETVNRYLSLVEGLLSEDAIEATAVAGADGYEYGMRIAYTDLLGDSVSYTLYFNKLFLEGEYDGGETEEEYAIEGELLAEGQRYPVVGNYETEQDGGESENELYFRAYLDESTRSYLEITQESESESERHETETEKEYVYTRYENGRRVERTVVEYEQKGNELELKLSIEREDEKDELTFESARMDGESVLLAEGTLSGEKVRFTVYIRAGGYHYVFEDGSYSDHDRYNDDDDDDWGDDDDDDDDDDDRRDDRRRSAGV